MYFLLCSVCFFGWFSALKCSSNFSLKEDYYYDYDSSDKSSEGFLIPNPETLPSNPVNADDSLDSDLKDHDFIDNLMYVYYGPQSKNRKKHGLEVIIVGSSISSTAQIFTIFYILLKKNGSNELRHLFLHLLSCLCFSNVLFALGVYAVKNRFRCLLVALVLHYTHLLSAFWMLLYCLFIYRAFCRGFAPAKRVFLLAAYTIPLAFSTLSYSISPHSFETKRFCFMSVQKGMIINYMLPVSLIIILTTFFSLNGMRKINLDLCRFEQNSAVNALRKEFNLQHSTNEDVLSLKETKTCLMLICLIQTGYYIVWFFSVLAVENDENEAFAIIYSTGVCLLNWLILLKVNSLVPTLNAADVVLVEECRQKEDNVPLLVAETAEMFRLDYISTISN